MSKQLKIFKHFQSLLDKRHGEDSLIERNIQDENTCFFSYRAKTKRSDYSHYTVNFFRETEDKYHVHFNQLSLSFGEEPRQYDGVADNISFEEVCKSEVDQIML